MSKPKTYSIHTDGVLFRVRRHIGLFSFWLRHWWGRPREFRQSSQVLKYIGITNRVV